MKKIKITIKDYSWSCGEGCCDEAGKEFYVDDEFVHRSPCEDNAWQAVLKHLGFDANIVWQDKDGEDICEL